MKAQNINGPYSRDAGVVDRLASGGRNGAPVGYSDGHGSGDLQGRENRSRTGRTTPAGSARGTGPVLAQLPRNGGRLLAGDHYGGILACTADLSSTKTKRGQV